MKTLKRLVPMLLVAALCLCYCAGALAEFPDKPITIVVPFKAGGNVDLCSRIVADELTKVLNVDVVIENREGGGAIIGQTYALNQPADGYTMLALTASFVTNVLSGDTDFGVEDVRCVGLMASDPEILMVSADSGITTVDELMKRGQEGVLINSTPGFSTAHHLACLVLANEYGLNFEYMHTNGSAEQVVQLAGGHADVGMSNYGGAATLIEEGKIIALATCADERYSALPDVPTMKELGYDFIYSSYRGFCVPAGTPEEVVKVLSDAVEQAMKSETVQQAFADGGFPLHHLNANDFQAMLEQDYANVSAIYSLLEE